MKIYTYDIYIEEKKKKENETKKNRIFHCVVGEAMYFRRRHHLPVSESF